MIRSTLLWVSENRWCRNTLPRYGFVRRAVRRFMPGETLDDALGAARSLAGRHLVGGREDDPLGRLRHLAVP